MKLFSYWRSSAAYRVRIALNLKGLDYDSVPVNLRDGQHREEAYLATNAQGLVPTLIDGDVIIGQSMAILEYLEEVYPSPALLPGDREQRALVRAACQAVACDIHPILNLRVLKYLKNELGQEQDAVDTWYRHWIATGFDSLEQMIRPTAGRYCFGDDITLADVLLVPQLYNARRFGCELSGFHKLLEIDGHLQTLDAFDSAAPENQADAD